MQPTSGNEYVDAIGKIHLEGNIIPHSWYNTVTFESGKPDLVGIILLADFVYWYRPTYVMDETTGQLKQVKKKFRADLLQRTYDKIAEQFGISKRQAQDACKRLDDLGLIKRVFRDEVINGRNVNNNLYIRVEHENIKRLTFGEPLLTRQEIDYLRNPDDSPAEDPSRFDGTPSNIEPERVPRQDGTPLESGRETNTDITSDTSLKISSKISLERDNVPQSETPPPAKPKKKKPTKQDYETIIGYLNEKTGKNFSPSVKSNTELINGRFDEGASVDDFKKVIDNKVLSWGKDTKMKEYLRPKTLFCGKNFDGYLNEGGALQHETDQGYSHEPFTIQEGTKFNFFE